MNPEGSGPNVPGPERFRVLSRTGVTVVTDWCPLSDLVSWVIPPLRPSLCKRPAWSLLTMAKAVDKLQCSECREFLALVRGAPLTRIACAHCQQAKQDPPGKARSGHGPQSRSVHESARLRRSRGYAKCGAGGFRGGHMPGLWDGLPNERGPRIPSANPRDVVG